MSWAKSRVAFQIKAMLEQAEYAIATIPDMANEDFYPKNNSYEDKKDIIKFLREEWEEARLPEDLSRLSDIIINFLKIIKSDLTELKKILILESKEKRGTNILNISPFNTIVLSYAYQTPTYFNNIKSDKFKLIVTDEFDLPLNVFNSLNKNGNIINLRSS
jgi:hypothetical protein